MYHQKSRHDTVSLCDVNVGLDDQLWRACQSMLMELRTTQLGIQQYRQLFETRGSPDAYPSTHATTQATNITAASASRRSNTLPKSAGVKTYESVEGTHPNDMAHHSSTYGTTHTTTHAMTHASRSGLALSRDLEERLRQHDLDLKRRHAALISSPHNPPTLTQSVNSSALLAKREIDISETNIIDNQGNTEASIPSPHTSAITSTSRWSTSENNNNSIHKTASTSSKYAVSSTHASPVHSMSIRTSPTHSPTKSSANTSTNYSARELPTHAPSMTNATPAAATNVMTSIPIASYSRNVDRIRDISDGLRKSYDAAGDYRSHAIKPPAYTSTTDSSHHISSRLDSCSKTESSPTRNRYRHDAEANTRNACHTPPADSSSGDDLVVMRNGDIVRRPKSKRGVSSSREPATLVGPTYDATLDTVPRSSPSTDKRPPSNDKRSPHNDNGTRYSSTLGEKCAPRMSNPQPQIVDHSSRVDACHPTGKPPSNVSQNREERFKDYESLKRELCAAREATRRAHEINTRHKEKAAANLNKETFFNRDTVNEDTRHQERTVTAPLNLEQAIHKIEACLKENSTPNIDKYTTRIDNAGTNEIVNTPIRNMDTKPRHDYSQTTPICPSFAEVITSQAVRSPDSLIQSKYSPITPNHDRYNSSTPLHTKPTPTFSSHTTDTPLINRDNNLYESQKRLQDDLLKAENCLSKTWSPAKDEQGKTRPSSTPEKKIDTSKPKKPLSSEELDYVNELIKRYTKQTPQQSLVTPVKSLKGNTDNYDTDDLLSIVN